MRFGAWPSAGLLEGFKGRFLGPSAPRPPGLSRWERHSSLCKIAGSGEIFLRLRRWIPDLESALQNGRALGLIREPRLGTAGISIKSVDALDRMLRVRNPVDTNLTATDRAAIFETGNASALICMTLGMLDVQTLLLQELCQFSFRTPLRKPCFQSILDKPRPLGIVCAFDAEEQRRAGKARMPTTA